MPRFVPLIWIVAVLCSASVPLVGCAGSHGHAHHGPHHAGHDQHQAGHAHEKVPASFTQAPAVGTRARCVVSDEVFTVAEDSPSSEHGGRVYVFCCANCKPKFESDPSRFAER